MSIQERSPSRPPFFRPFIDNLEEIKQAWRGSTTEEKVKAFAKAVIFIVASALILSACRTLLNKAFHIDNAGLTMAVTTVTLFSIAYLSNQLLKHLNEEREAN